MKAQQKQVLDSLTGMQRFLNLHSRTMATVNPSPVRGALDELLCAVPAQEAAQRAAKLRIPTRRARLGELRHSLLCAHVRPIVRFARKRASKAPMLACLRVPARNLPTHKLVPAAAAIATLVREHRTVFLSEGFPDDFLEQLGTANEAVMAAESEYRACRWERDHAADEIRQLIARGRSIARVLDSLVVAALEGNAALKAEWREAKSLRRPAEHAARVRRGMRLA